MPLINILQDVGQVLGWKISNASEKPLYIARINKAAAEIYSSRDLEGCLREQVIDVEMVYKQTTLPYYVQQVRGVRKYDNRTHVKLNDMRPRYFYGEANAYQKLFEWRAKFHVPVARNLESSSTLTLRLGSACTGAFSAYIVGSTASAERVQEVVEFAVGDTTHQTTNNFTPYSPTGNPGLMAIAKSGPIDQNLIVDDANGNELAVIPNHETESKYLLLQIADEGFDSNLVSADGCQCFEILYKIRFSPFVNDYDEFPVREIEQAIKWKTLSHYFAQQSDGADKAIGYEMKCQQVLEQVDTDAEQGIEKEIQFKPNGYSNLTTKSWNVDPLYPRLWP